MPSRHPVVQKHSGYRNLKTFALARLVYDITVRFVDRYINKRSRTHDQMVQAARSGVQNIAEGSTASGTSKKTELKLTNVARASLEELRLDYEDYLRHRGLRLWERDDPRRRELIARQCKTVDEVASWVNTTYKHAQRGQHRLQGQHEAPPTYQEIAANAALIIIAVTCALLDRQIAAQARDFEQQGGFTERLYRIRTTRRG